MMEKRWYVIQTKPGQEQLAVLELQKQSFEIFFPTYTRETLTPKENKIVLRVHPLFPSYIFTLFDIDMTSNWKSINGTRGVMGLVGLTDNWLTPVSRGCVEELLGRRDQAGHIPIEQAVEDLLRMKYGEEVEIMEGAFAGNIATYCNHSANRVQLFLSLLQSRVRVELPLNAIQPLKPFPGGRR
jgi:transcriptional antiterminator RfaH